MRAIGYAAVFVVGLLVIGAIGIAMNAEWLAYMPWRIHQETKIVRHSNGYITAQQEQLRQFRTDYDAAPTQEQKLAIRRQMQETADLIPQDVQPDILAFLGR